METISPSAATNIAQRLPWHSPLPYLFGGLAAMLTLISFALVILACSYWNLSRHNRDGADLESRGGNDAKIDSTTASEKINYDEKVLVIMAGNQTPTFLATPVCVSISSSAVETAADSKSEENETAENSEKSKKQFDREVSTGVQESSEERNE